MVKLFLNYLIQFSWKFLMLPIIFIFFLGIQCLANMQIYGLLGGIKSIFASELLMVQLFLYSFAGENLSSRIMKLSFAIYQISWYNLPKKLSQDLYFILMITEKPFTLTAGKMFPMNMKTFSSILKATFSFFSLLRLMYHV